MWYVLGKPTSPVDIRRDQQAYIDALKKIKPEQFNWYVKKSVWDTFKGYLLINALFALIGESFGVFNCYYISNLISFISDPEQTYETGVYLLVVFSTLNIISQLCRNLYI